MPTKTASKKGATKKAAAKKSSAKKSSAKTAPKKEAPVKEIPAGTLNPEAKVPDEQVQASEETKQANFDKLNIPPGYQGVNPHENNPDMRTAIGNETARKALAE